MIRLSERKRKGVKIKISPFRLILALHLKHRKLGLFDLC